MSSTSNIEWTGHTWNPLAGCSVKSPGCKNCYAMPMAARLERMIPGLTHYHDLTKKVNGKTVFTGKVSLAPDHILYEPLRRKKPTTWFVNSMSDLFHENVPDEWIDTIFAVMALCPQHTFQVLTKRSDRMRRYVTLGGSSWRILDAMRGVTESQGATSHWPLPNVWLGVSAERQQEADERVPDLLNTFAAVRFVSAEPLLGPINFKPHVFGFAVRNPGDCAECGHGHGFTRCPNYGGVSARCHKCDCKGFARKVGEGIDWIIVGGESGHGARPMHPDWSRSIRDQCQAAGIAFFFKQWGQHEATVAAADMQDHLIHSGDKEDLRDGNRRCEIVWPDGKRIQPVASFDWWDQQDFDAPDGVESQMTGCPVVMRAVGKATAGRQLDGREWNEMPGGSSPPKTEVPKALENA